MRWRWDQGRLQYFRFDTICSIARVLCGLDGLSLSAKDDLLRAPLMMNTDMPFDPPHYKVWRNYARVFQCSMLAARIGDVLLVTDVCRNLAGSDPMSSDEYLAFVFSHFCLPYPAFDDYNTKERSVYPFSAIIKLLIAMQGKPLSLDDVFSLVVGNECTGMEDLSFYRTLKHSNREPIGDEKRQVREMLVFMAQTSYIRWFDSKLYLDTSNVDAALSAASPYLAGVRESDAWREFLRMTSLEHYVPPSDIIADDRMVGTFSVKEGRKAFASHNRIERSPLVRDRFFKKHPACVCDMCHLSPPSRYPWLNGVNILELHHILPLSATLNMNGTTTTLDDLEPLCPTCHRSVHAFYKIKLNEWGIADFSSRKMAKDVYDMARKEVSL